MTAEGHSVNVTLIFSLERYDEVITAYIEGLEDLATNPTANLSKVASVASFFISRVDTEVDARLQNSPDRAAESLCGKAAIAQAQLAYDLFTRRFNGERWRALVDRGAGVQRPLWASTSTKNPNYPDTLYVDRLIGPNTVNTLPDQTLESFDDHGNPKRTIDTDLPGARQVWSDLARCGVDMADVSAKLEREGIASFQSSFTDLLATLAAKADNAGRQ
jgi:transaldolase